jgi:hypothetical protein
MIDWADTGCAGFKALELGNQCSGFLKAPIFWN